MSFSNVDDVIDAMVSHALSLGHFDHVNQFEPTADPAPGNGLTAAIWVQNIRPAPRASGLNVVSFIFTLNVRLYLSLLTAPKDYIDPVMVKAIDALFTAYIGDFTLGDEIMHVDIFGAHGPDMLEAEAGYVEQSTGDYRVYDISVPLILADLYTETP